MRVKLHQILLGVIMDGVSAQRSYGPGSNPSITCSDVCLIAPKVGVSLYLCKLVEPGNHHVRSGGAKGIRSCRRFLNPYSEELKTHLATRLSRTEEIAIDEQLRSLIVDSQSLIAISEIRCRLGNASARRGPQDVLSDQIIDQDPTTFITFDDVMKYDTVPSIQSGCSRYPADVMTKIHLDAM